MSEALRVAGSDTREAMATPTVRAAAFAAGLAAAPGWAAAILAPAAWGEHLAMDERVAPWFAIALITSGVLAAAVAWRRGPETGAPTVPSGTAEPYRIPPGFGALLILILLCVVAGASNDETLVAMLLPLVPALSGWAAGQAARLSTGACVPAVLPAASGVVVAFALAGVAGGLHLARTGTGSGARSAAWWTIAYVAGAAVHLIRARRSLDVDRKRIWARAALAAKQSEPVRHPGRGEPMLVLERVDVSFGPNHVLRDASVTVGAGELVALVGGNGAGKSTLLRVAAGLIAPDAGRILLDGDDVSTLRPEERSAAGLAFVSGARPVFPDLTVIENLRVAAYRSHQTQRSFDRATEAVLALVPTLAHRPRAKAGVLSGGEQRLLAVAQTLYRIPVALLADELTLGLDLDARLAVLDLLRVLADRGVAVVAVDHDLPSLLPRADRAALITEGGVVLYPKPATLLEQRQDLLPATFLAGAGI